MKTDTWREKEKDYTKGSDHARVSFVSESSTTRVRWITVRCDRLQESVSQCLNPN